MPIYLFTCGDCNLSKKFFVSPEQINDARKCQNCQSVMTKNFGMPDVLPFEQTDEYRGWSRFEGTNQKRKERSDEHWRRVELPKIIEKNGKAFAIRMGYLKPEDEPK